MYRSDKYYMKVHIDLEPGVYVFPHTSASGKTYLAHTLEKYRRVWGNQLGHTATQTFVMECR